MIQPIAKPTPKVRERKPLRSRPHVIPAAVKQGVFTRQDYICAWCNVPGGALDCHHRLPSSRGGRDIAAHCVGVHRLCHSFIHEHPAEALERGFLVHTEADLSEPVR